MKGPILVFGVAIPMHIIAQVVVDAMRIGKALILRAPDAQAIAQTALRWPG